MKPIQASRILVYRIGQLGDTIIALPAMWAVRRHFPRAHLALLSDRHYENEYVLAPSVLPKEGLFDEYIAYDASINGANPVKMLKVLPRLRQGRFDKLIYLAPRTRTRWQVWRDIVFFRVAGITQFIGHRGFRPLPRSAPGSPLPYIEHEADHLLKRLACSGIFVPSPGQGCMDLQLTKVEVEEARKWIKSHVDSDHNKRLVAVGPGSKWPSKVWPEERYRALGRCLIDEFGMFPLVFGGSEDREIGKRLIAHWGLGANAAGELSVRQAAATLVHCRLYVGNDTGVMHLAAAVGTPCVAIFSAQDWPGRWYPYGQGHIVLRSAVLCEGCRLRVCNRDLNCLKKISVDDVAQACRQVLVSTDV